MSAPEVYHQVHELIRPHLAPEVDASTRERIALLVTGMIGAKSASPAQVARALERLQLTGASPESLERRIRRLENDPELSASWCFHPFARFHLRFGHPQELLLILDPTSQEDRWVMVSLAVWYRGRALPLGWAVWPANTPLEGDRFWARIDALLEEVVPLLPGGVTVTLLADRAFGCPAFIDLLVKRGWHFVLRAQGQTRCRDRCGRERSLASLVPYRHRRAKLRGEAFKSRLAGGERGGLLGQAPSKTVVSGQRLATGLGVAASVSAPLPDRSHLPRLQNLRLALGAGAGPSANPCGAALGGHGPGHLAGAAGGGLAGRTDPGPARHGEAAHAALGGQTEPLPARLGSVAGVAGGHALTADRVAVDGVDRPQLAGPTPGPPCLGLCVGLRCPAIPQDF